MLFMIVVSFFFHFAPYCLADICNNVCVLKEIDSFILTKPKDIKLALTFDKYSELFDDFSRHEPQLRQIISNYTSVPLLEKQEPD